MSEKKTDTSTNKFVESSTVEKSTAAGSHMYTFRLTTEGERAITVKTDKKD